MPKQVFDGKKVSVLLDDTIPAERAELVRRDLKGKASALTQADKLKLFDAYVNAGIIKIDN